MTTASTRIPPPQIYSDLFLTKNKNPAMFLMKTVLIAASSAMIQALAAHPKDFIPAPPPYDKPVANYTAEDVVGCAFSTQELLPNGHPFRAKGAEKTIRQQWPGAKTAANVDVILAYVINAQTPYEERAVGEGLFWCIHEMMDIPKSAQAEAFTRLYAAQSDPQAKRKIAFMAPMLFPYLAQASVLAPLKDMLDDSTVYETFRTEERGMSTTSVRRKAGGFIFKMIFARDRDLLSVDLPEGEFIMSNADKASIFGDDVPEADSCARLKTWLTTHWGTIESQCVKIAAATSPPYSLPRKKYLVAPPSGK